MRTLHDPRIPVATLALALLVALVPAARADWPHDPYVNVQIAPSGGTQTAARMVADGQGGFYATWTESRTGYSTVYLQHVGADGQIVPGWPADGFAATTPMTSHQWYPSIAADAGGVYVAWQDDRNGGSSSSDIYAQRVTPAGSLAPGWPGAGLRLGLFAVDENHPACADDGAGDLYVVWEYVYAVGPPSDIDLYGAYVHADATVAYAGAIENPIYDQVEPVITADGAGGFTVAYRDDNGGTGAYWIDAVHYAAGFVYNWQTFVSSGGGGDQYDQQIVADGTGGYVIAWVDTRGGTDDIYAMRLTDLGALATGWTANGVPVCDASGSQNQVQLCPDGSGGALFAWRDGRNDTGDLYACRLAASGGIAPGWTPNGTAVAINTSAQFNPAIAADGAGGAYIVWTDLRPDFLGCYGARVAGNGSLLPGWTYGGTEIGRLSLGTSTTSVVGDGGTGALVMFDDRRTSSNQLYAQRVDRFGALGNPEPVIEQVRDVTADQGGRVRLEWTASYLDQEAFPNLDSYWIWRQVPAGLAASRVAQGGEWLDDWLASARTAASASATALPDAPAAGLYLQDADATVAYAWEYVTSQPASAFPTYSYTASTTTDSIAGSNPYTVFMVQARGSSYGTFWNSAPDSGYSVDNLSPAIPSPATWTWSSGRAFLHWGANSEADLAGYRLYRGPTAGFVPSAGNLISAQPDTGYVDDIGTLLYYKLSAVDVHGNESGYALFAPGGLTGVDPGATPTALSFAPPGPNPSGGPVSLRFTLPREGPVQLQVFDPMGRTVREFHVASMGPGEHTIVWDGRDSGGRGLPAGLYVIRLEAAGSALVRRTVRLSGR